MVVKVEHVSFIDRLAQRLLYFYSHLVQKSCEFLSTVSVMIFFFCIKEIETSETNAKIHEEKQQSRN